MLSLIERYLESDTFMVSWPALFIVYAVCCLAVAGVLLLGG